MDKRVKFAAFRGKTQEFAVSGQIRELCESEDDLEKCNLQQPMIDCWILSFLRNMSTYYRSLTSLSFIPMRVRWLLLWRCVRTNVELQLVRVWDWETVENSCSSWCSRAGDSIDLIITEHHWTACNQSIMIMPRRYTTAWRSTLCHLNSDWTPSHACSPTHWHRHCQSNRSNSTRAC